jgi:large subunit ribosomal protein L28
LHPSTEQIQVAQILTQEIMSKVCQITGRKTIVGNKVSHSNHKTKRTFMPNLQTKRFFIAEEDKWITLKVSTSALRTINKIGIAEALKRGRALGLIKR